MADRALPARTGRLPQPEQTLHDRGRRRDQAGVNQPDGHVWARDEPGQHASPDTGPACPVKDGDKGGANGRGSKAGSKAGAGHAQLGRGGKSLPQLAFGRAGRGRPTVDLGEPEWAELVHAYGLHKDAHPTFRLRDNVHLAAEDNTPTPRPPTRDDLPDRVSPPSVSPSTGGLIQLPQVGGARNWVAFLHDRTS